MNWQRGLLRFWFVLSVIWAGAFIIWVWFTLPAGTWQTYGPKDYTVFAIVIVVPPLIVLIVGATVAWIVKGFRR